MSTREYVSGPREVKDSELWDMCEHLYPGDMAHVVECVDDVYDPVSRNALCKSCAEAGDIKANNSAYHLREAVIDAVKQKAEDILTETKYQESIDKLLDEDGDSLNYDDDFITDDGYSDSPWR